MVDPADVPRVLGDAARLVGQGRLVVLSSAALAMRMKQAPQTHDIDVWCEPAERGDLVTALMGELSWYQERHGVYMEVWGPETFAAPDDWLTRAETFTNGDAPGATLVVPHPHDIVVAKLERWETHDRAHARIVLDAFPLTREGLGLRLARTPYRTGRVVAPDRLFRFEAHAAELLAMSPG